MTRLAAALLILMASAAPCRGGGIHPRRAYVGLFAGLGAVGGGALGIAMGGLQRPSGSGDKDPLMKWGLAGAAFGGLLGYEIGQDELLSADRATSAISPGISGSSACLGAILGQLAAIGISAAGDGAMDWESRSVWANIALGTLLGAGMGAILPSLRVVRVPPAQSLEEREASRTMTKMEPLLPEERTPREPADLGPALAGKSLVSPPPASAEIMALDSSLLPAGDSHLIDPSSAVFTPPPRADEVRHQSGAVSLHPVMRSVVYLALLEGIMLGATAAGATGDALDDFTGRIVVGGALGGLAGFSAGTAFVRPWLGEDAQSISQGETIAVGERLSGTLSGGLIGSILGAAAGATLRNSLDNFDSRDASGLALAGSLAGLVVGAVLTGGLQPY